MDLMYVVGLLIALVIALFAVRRSIYRRRRTLNAYRKRMRPDGARVTGLRATTQRSNMRQFEDPTTTAGAIRDATQRRRRPRKK